MLSAQEAYEIAQGTDPKELRHNQNGGRNEGDMLHN